MKINNKGHNELGSDENVEIPITASDITPNNEVNITNMNLFEATDGNTPDDAIEIVMVPNIMKLEGMTKDIEEQARTNQEF